MHLSFEWNQIGWFTLPIKWHPFGHEAIGHEATKVTRWDQGLQVFLFRILTIKKEGRSTIYENEYIMILKKARLGPSDLRNSKVYINFSNNTCNSMWALSQHTLTVAH